MKVALVKPPVAGHGARGIGFYGQRLYEALSKVTDASWVDFSYLPIKGFDIIHYPYCDLFWPTIAPIHFGKTIVTLHDVIPLKFPNYFPLGVRAKVIWPWQKFLLRNVSAIITDSYCSQKDIGEFVGLNPKRIFVTYLAADKIFCPLKIKRENFVLYVGGGNWNKNVITLVRACKKGKFPLIIVGKEFTVPISDHTETKPIMEVLKEAEGVENIRFLGFVETKELVKLYNQARVYVQPSIYEGFGLPVLEAMACGTPVICGSNSSLIEIAGDAATYADINSVDDLAEKISKIKPTGKEVSQAAKFSWENTARNTYEVYLKVLERD